MPLPHTHQFEAIGTTWSIETNSSLLEPELSEIKRIIASFDRTYSRFRKDSMVTRAHKQAGTFSFPPTIVNLYDTYMKLESVTDGAVNPLVGETLEKLGYDADYSLKQTAAPVAPPSFTHTVKRQQNSLIFQAPALLDIGAIGKGCLVDLIANYLSASHQEYVVDGGGDIAIHTQKPYVIGLENPYRLGEAIGSVELDDKSICASAPNRRAWGDDLHHIIDARTGKPAKTDVVATWAVADTALLADALSTALFFTSPKRLHESFGRFQYVIMMADGRIEYA